MIDVFSLSRLVGSVTLQKGLDYARRGTVSSVEIGEKPLRLSGLVRGGTPRPYRVEVSLSVDRSSVTALTGICTCPVHMNCKHVVALIITGLSQRRDPTVPARPAWERTLSGLMEQDRNSSETEALSLGLQFELLPPTGPAGAGSRSHLPEAAGLGIRPVQLGNAGRWIRTGITWSNLGYFGYGRSRPRPDHLNWLAAIAAVANGSTAHHYGSAPAWIRLEQVTSGAVWDLLGRAEELNIALIGSDRAQQPVAMAADPVDLVLDVARAVDGLALQVLVHPEQETEQGLLLGDPVRGLATWPAVSSGLPLRERPLRLLQFRSAPSEQLVALLDSGRQQIPSADEEKFLSTYLPVLRQRIPVVSRDESFQVPAPVPPELWLTLVHLPDHRLTFRWGWRYAGTDVEQALWPDHRSAAYRDLPTESNLLEQLPNSVSSSEDLVVFGRLSGEGVLVGMQAVGFVVEVLPELADSVVHLDIRGTANYRAADNDAMVGISGEPSDGRDWFDLQITVTVDGEKVALQDIFLALAQQQDFMILPSGTYFPLESEKFGQLRRLIEEARLLHDAPENTMRVSRFQASLWDELQQLGVIDEQAAAWHQRVSGLLDVSEIRRQELPADFTASLRPYQQVGFDWLSFLYDAGLGGILADDMGLGKTIQALALIARAVSGPASCSPFLVVAPTSVVGNWKSEAAKFAPNLAVATITETGGRRGVPIAELAGAADVVVTSYALFRLEFDAYQDQEWAGLILDEAQFVKNHHSLGFKNAKSLATGFKLAITGTPMENNLLELWSLFSITAPGLFGSPTRFAEYYQKPIERLAETDKLDQLRRRIRPLMLRRNKELVAKELPPKQEQVIELELNPRHQKIYQTHLQRERQKVLGLIGDLDKNRFVIFRSLTLLRQLSLDASLIDEKYAAVPSTKLDALMEQLDDVIAEGHRVLVFSQFTSFLGKVRTRLDAARVDYCYLDGSTRRRADVLQKFSTGNAPVFLISLKAGGFGLNLTEADYCILLDPWWNPATEAQAVDRAHRIGQHKTVMVYRLVAKGTIEEKVMALKESKAKLFSSVMNDGAAGSAALTADDIRSLLS